METPHEPAAVLLSLTCKDWLENGKCKYGETCSYPHQRFTCMHFFYSGECKFGNSCQLRNFDAVPSNAGKRKHSENCQTLYFLSSLFRAYAKFEQTYSYNVCEVEIFTIFALSSIAGHPTNVLLRLCCISWSNFGAALVGPTLVWYTYLSVQ